MFCGYFLDCVLLGCFLDCVLNVLWMFSGCFNSLWMFSGLLKHFLDLFWIV